MRKLLLILFSLACLVHAPKVLANPLIVNSCTINQNGVAGPGQCTIANVHPGDTIVVFDVTLTSTCPNYSLSDSLGLTYTNKNLQCGGFIAGEENLVLALDVATTGTSSGSDTFSLTNNQFNFSFATVDEISGLSTFDAAAGSNGTGATSTTISSGNLTTAQSGDYLISGTWLYNGGSAPTATSGSGFTVQTSLTGSTYNQYAEDKAAGAAGTYAGTFTVGSTTASVWGVIAGAFLVSSSGTVPRHPTGFY